MTHTADPSSRAIPGSPPRRAGVATGVGTGTGAPERAGDPMPARRVLALVALALLPVLALLVLWFGRNAFFILFAGMLLAALLDALIGLVEGRSGLARRMAAGIVIGGVVVVLAALTWWGGSTLVASAGDLYDALGKQAERVGGFIEGVRPGDAGAPGPPESPLGVLREVGAIMSGGDGGMATSFVGATMGALANTVLIFFLGIFLAIEPAAYRRGLVRLFPPDRREGVDDALRHAGDTLRRWLIGKLISMAIVGALTGIGLAILGYPFALPLALLAGALAFIPNLGPILTYIPIALAGLGEGADTVLWGVGVYAVVQTLESYVATPLIQKHMVSLPPALILFAQVLGAILFGLWGIALATPLAAVLREWVQRYYVRHELEGEPIEELRHEGRG